MTGVLRNLGFGIGIALLIAGGLYWYTGHSKSQTVIVGGSNATSTPTTELGGVSGTGSYTVEPVGIAPPALGPVVISESFPTDATVVLRGMIEEQYAILREEPTRVDVWLQLGVNRKIGSDFAGAIEAWDYAAAVAPDEMRATAYGNLADLYLYFLKEYDKAEADFKQAIALNPHIIDYYRTLYYLYRDIRNDPAKEAAILAQGLEANPGNADLIELQKQLASSTAQ